MALLSSKAPLTFPRAVAASAEGITGKELTQQLGGYDKGGVNRQLVVVLVTWRGGDVFISEIAPRFSLEMIQLGWLDPRWWRRMIAGAADPAEVSELTAGLVWARERAISGVWQLVSKMSDKLDGPATRRTWWTACRTGNWPRRAGSSRRTRQSTPTRAGRN